MSVIEKQAQMLIDLGIDIRTVNDAAGKGYAALQAIEDAYSSLMLKRALEYPIWAPVIAGDI